MLRAAYRTLADDVRPDSSSSPAADWLLDNFHLVAAEISDIRRNLPRTYSRTLPTLASREHAGHARVYAMAVELIRHSDSRLDRPAAAPVPEQLPARRAADDRRALGVAEHAEARAHREPAPAGRRDAGRARSAARRRRVRRAGRRSDRSLALPPAADTAFVVQLLHRVREYGLAAVRDPRRRRRRPRRAAHDGRGHDPRRAPAPGRRTGLGRERRDEPAALRDAGLAGVRRGGQPRRAGAAARSRRRVRADGLPEPRSAAPGGRRAGRAERRSAGPRGAEGGRERAPGSGARSPDRSLRRTSAITSSIAGAAISRPTSPIGPASPTARPAAAPSPRLRRCTSARSPR